MATLKALLFLVAASSNVFAVEGIEAPIPGYGAETLHPRAAPVSFNGTIEEVISKAKQLSTRWARDLEKRELPSVLPYKIECADEKRWKKAYRWYIQDGLTYLSKLRAKPKMGPGPGNCSRVSCSYEAAIWWCNDIGIRIEERSLKLYMLKAQQVSGLPGCDVTQGTDLADGLPLCRCRATMNWMSD